MIEESVACGGEDLSNDVLIDITEIGGEFVGEEFLINYVFGDVLIPEGQGDEQAGVSNVHLVLAIVGLHGHAYMRIFGMMGKVDGKAVFEVFEIFVHLVLLFTASQNAGLLIA